MKGSDKAFFAPQLYIKHGITDISFYEKAFGAVIRKKLTNNDGSIHVAELSIEGAIFHIHEEKVSAGEFNPLDINGTTVLVGLFVPDVDYIVAKALDAGAVLVSPAESYDYGYRQGEIKDPFGHVWMIEMKI